MSKQKAKQSRCMYPVESIWPWSHQPCDDKTVLGHKFCHRHELVVESKGEHFMQKGVDAFFGTKTTE